MKRLQAIAAMMLVAVIILGGLGCDDGKGEPGRSLETSDVSVPNITDTSATVTWDTNRAASSQVEYGTGTEYGTLSTTDNELVSNHSVVINGLSQETTYHFRVRSADADGNQAASKDQTFKTLVSPVDSPNFEFLHSEQCESHSYGPSGACISTTIGVPLENTGGAGDAFVAMAYKGSDSVEASNVFHFDKGESAMVYTRFSSCPTFSTFEWTARVASSSDTSLGKMWLERQDGSTDNGLPHSAIKDGCLTAVWGSSPSRVFAVGSKGIILRYDGSAWDYMTSGTMYQLNGVWGSSATNVFAVGQSGTILHYDGSTWSRMSLPGSFGRMDATTFSGVWGSSSHDVFAVGDTVGGLGSNATILHYDGNVWSLMTGGAKDDVLRGVWGSSASDVFAVGERHTPSAVNTSNPLRALILHYDGTAWSVVMVSNVDTANDYLRAVWGSSPSDVYAVGTTRAHYDGSVWSMVSGDGMAVWGSSATDIFAMGCRGSIVHYDGNTWSLITIP